MRYRPISERFQEKVSVNTKTKCWNWTGSVSRGYGYIIGERTEVGAKRVFLLVHRYAFEKAGGVIPEGMLVLHSCNNPLCVNPDHLKLGTHADNMMDLKKSGRAIGRPKRSTLTPPQLARVRRDLRSGVPQKEIARVLGVHRGTIQRAALYCGLAKTDIQPRSTLSDDEKTEIRQKVANGEPILRIAKQFGVDRKTIRNIRDKT